MAGHQGTSSSIETMEKCIIVAVSDNLAIGRNNDLPWHISEDLKFFRKTTSGYPVIMGRKTFLSIGRPLPKRLNIVLTSDPTPVEGIVKVRTLEEAYAVAAEASDKCFVMGGASVYRSALEDMDRLYVTHVHTVLEDADAFFPEIDSEVWTVADRSETLTDPETGYPFEFVVYTRR